MSLATLRAIAQHEGKCIDCRRRKAARDRIRCRKCLKAQAEQAKAHRTAGRIAPNNHSSESQTTSVSTPPASTACTEASPEQPTDEASPN